MKLKELRLTKKISQVDLAKRFQLTQGTYSNYENETTQPDIKFLCELADFYEVSLDTLVGRNYLNDIGYLTPNQKNIVVMAKKLNETNQLQVIGYIAGLLANQGG